MILAYILLIEDTTGDYKQHNSTLYRPTKRVQVILTFDYIVI